MICKVLTRTLVFCLLACIVMASAMAQSAKDLVGKWNMTSETQQDPVTWSLTLKEVDGKLAGMLQTDGDPVEAKGFSYENGVLRFKTPYQGQDYDIELKLDGAKLKGTWSGGGDSGATYGTKAQ